MSSAATLRWLAELQARFSDVLRTPLDASSGRLRARPESYPASACADIVGTRQRTAAERLSVYQRQYWMRLLRVLQEQYPLTMRLLGAFFFNQHALRFLCAHPPRHVDLGDAAEGFHVFLETELAARVPRDALLEAARLDASFRRVFCAPEQPGWRPSVMGEAGLAQRKLHISAAVACVEEHWPLLALRGEVMAQAAEHAVPVPPALAHARHWLLQREMHGITQRALDPLHARLLHLLETRCVGEALARLESSLPAAELDGLPERVREFFALGARSGWFVDRGDD